MKAKHRITLERKGSKPSAVRIEVTPEMLRLCKDGAALTGATVPQVLLWTFKESVESMNSFINGGMLEQCSHEPHLLKA